MDHKAKTAAQRPINEMKCPFRVDDKGEFMPCLGDFCMAYFEYEHIPYVAFSTCQQAPDPVLIRQCRRLSALGPINSCV